MKVQELFEEKMPVGKVDRTKEPNDRADKYYAKKGWVKDKKTGQWYDPKKNSME